jgi:hypothetical protein
VVPELLHGPNGLSSVNLMVDLEIEGSSWWARPGSPPVPMAAITRLTRPGCPFAASVKGVPLKGLLHGQYQIERWRRRDGCTLVASLVRTQPSPDADVDMQDADADVQPMQPLGLAADAAVTPRQGMLEGAAGDGPLPCHADAEGLAVQHEAAASADRLMPMYPESNVDGGEPLSGAGNQQGGGNADMPTDGANGERATPAVYPAVDPPQVGQQGLVLASF